MRLVRVSAPRGKGAEVAKVAFACGISDVSVHEAEQHKPGSKAKPKDVVDAHVATPQARTFVEAVQEAPFFDREDYSIDVREPRAILKSTSVREITHPVPAPLVDIDQELWQFSHVTYSFVLRVLIAAALLSYGMIKYNPLLMIGGLVFLPLMPLTLGAAFGTLSRQWNLVAQSAIAFVSATLLITAGAAVVALVAEPPMMFEKFPPLLAGFLFSLAIGLASSLATADDVGHRQLIGLAAASQLALIPAWFGISLVFGFSESATEKLSAFGLNVIALIAGAAIVYAVLTWRGEILGAQARKIYKH